MSTDIAARLAALTTIDRPPQIAGNHALARRYSLARRNLLPRDDRVIAVQGRWAHQQLLDLGAGIETVLWCPDDDRRGSTADIEVATLCRRLSGSAAGVYQISPRTLA